MEKIIYTAELIGNLNLFLNIIMTIGWVVFVIDFFASGESGSLEYPKTRKQLGILFGVAMILTMAVIFIPSKRTYLRMHAAEVIEEYQENSYWKKALPESTVQIINEWIKENEQSK